jgi:hypothetical protein
MSGVVAYIEHPATRRTRASPNRVGPVEKPPEIATAGGTGLSVPV